MEVGLGSVLSARGLEVARSGLLIIRGVSMDLRKASWNGLIGANGSGKTTLIRALAGRLPLRGGDILLDGLKEVPNRISVAENIGLSPDAHDLPPNLSGDEYLRLVSWRMDASVDLKPLEAALDFRGFSARAIGEMSTGMKQRIAIYAAFVNGNRTVFLDEPFNWLDPVCSFETKRALKALVQDQGFTLLTALHDMATLAVFCDHGFLMSRGRIVRELDAPDLRIGSTDFAVFEANIIQSLL